MLIPFQLRNNKNHTPRLNLKKIVNITKLKSPNKNSNWGSTPERGKERWCFRPAQGIKLRPYLKNQTAGDWRAGKIGQQLRQQLWALLQRTWVQFLTPMSGGFTTWSVSRSRSVSVCVCVCVWREKWCGTGWVENLGVGRGESMIKLHWMKISIVKKIRRQPPTHTKAQNN